MTPILARLIPILFAMSLSISSSAITFELPSLLGPENVGIVVNDLDPMSVVVGEYYRQQRQIPAENVFHIKLPTGPAISKADFFGAKTTIDLHASRDVQVLALTWSAPYRVECMSITTAFAMVSIRVFVRSRAIRRWPPLILPRPVAVHTTIWEFALP